jgi:FkbM family methyltransferase
MNRTLIHRTTKDSFIDVLEKNLANKCLAKNSEKFVIERGQRMAVYANEFIGAKIYTNGILEREEITDLLLVLETIGIDLKESTALDIGANIGNHTIEFAKFFGHVEAYEPNPHTYKLLDFNCSYRENISCHNFGCGDKDESLTLYEHPFNNGASSTHLEDLNKNYNKLEIKISKIDSFSNKFRNVKLIKIDVESMEHQVILGAVNTIISHKPVIAFEQNVKEFIEPYNETKTIDFLRTLGYEMFWLKNQTTKIPWVIRRIKNIYQLFFGYVQKREIISNTKVPRGSHNMILAIHKDNIKDI